jgi:hypothetical protein
MIEVGLRASDPKGRHHGFFVNSFDLHMLAAGRCSAGYLHGRARHADGLRQETD